MTATVLDRPPAGLTRMQIQSKISRIKVEIGNLDANRQRAESGRQCKVRELRRLEAELATCSPAPARAFDE